MRTTIISTLVVSSVVALFSQQAEGRMTGAMVENGQHLHLLNKRAELAQAPHQQHRRHHVKLGKRSTCKSSSASSSSSVNAKVSVADTAGTVESASSDSSSSSASADSSPSSSSSASSAKSTSSSSSSTSSSTSSDSSSTKASSSVSAFQGTNTGIGSWFRTNSGQDSTNGQSWCQTYYQDDWPCFAPSVGTMLSNFGGDYNKAATAYCGLEAKVTDPKTGNSITGFICDGFDDKWVKSAGSIDLTVGAFTSLYGSFDSNKNTVISGVKWELTGNVVSKGTFQNGKKW